MSIQELQKCNPEYEFYTVQDEQFHPFGRWLPYDASEWIEQTLKKHPVPDKKASYFPDDLQLHEHALIKTIHNEIYGQLDIQVGIVHGKNEYLTGIEFHQGSEVNIALTDCILLLGKKEDMKDTTYDAAKTKKFYIKKGQVLEIYGSTLHYTPVQASTEGFSLGVILLKGTNTDMDAIPHTMLIKKNKWYITHASQTEKIKAGCIAGLLGDMLHIQPYDATLLVEKDKESIK